MTADLYAELGIPRSSSKAAIRAGYRKAAKRAHPDAGGSPEKFQRIQTALAVLTDDLRRERYDRGDGFDEGAPVDNALSNMLNEVSAIIDIALGNMVNSGRIIERANMIAEMRTVIAGLKRKLSEEIEALSKAKSCWRVLAGRFSPKDDAMNYMEQLVAGKISQIEQMSARTQERNSRLDEAAKFLDGYDYRADHGSQYPQGPTMVSLADLMNRGMAGLGGR